MAHIMTNLGLSSTFALKGCQAPGSLLTPNSTKTDLRPFDKTLGHKGRVNTRINSKFRQLE